MFQLIRDNIPELMQKNDQVCNFAQIQNPELMTGCLRDKLIQCTNDFLRADPTSDASLESLIDIATVIRFIYNLGGLSDEEFEQRYKAKLEVQGDFHNGYIMFFNENLEGKEEKA
jgi:predicted house-cleaning noncanonical NTP pyrophosphatase (MazG superfamily)